MRYFRTTNASRRYVAGPLGFTFEPVENIGGSWIGLLAVKDDFAASQLASAKHPQVSEITAEEHDALKKKAVPSNPNFRDSPTQASNRPAAAAVPAARPVSTPSAESAPLRTAKVEVPDEIRSGGAADSKPPQRRHKP